MAVDFLFLTGPRACGKSTVAQALFDALPGWRQVDLDHEFDRRCRDRGRVSVDSAEYYEGCLEILRSFLEQKRVIMALGGGTLINAHVDPRTTFKTMVSCKNRGEMILLLPSRFDCRNRRILQEREFKRPYVSSQEVIVRSYDQRVDFFRDNADFIVYGGPPEKAARKIIKRYKLLG